MKSLAYFLVILGFINHAFCQDFSKKIEGKSYTIDHNPDAISKDLDFESSTHTFKPAGIYQIDHPKGKFIGTWQYNSATKTLEVRFKIGGKDLIYKGEIEELSETRFIAEVVFGKDGESQSLLFIQK